MYHRRSIARSSCARVVCRIVDNLPAAYGRPGRANYADGFPLGGVLELPDGTVGDRRVECMTQARRVL